MNEFDLKLNELMSETFRSIVRIEGKSIRESGVGLSINELHLLEAVCKTPGSTAISDIALGLGVTLPSVTIAVKKLEAKGYVVRGKDEHDGRIVRVYLTRQGQQMCKAHLRFHENMIKSTTKMLTDEEKLILLKVIDKLNDFFKAKANNDCAT